LASLRQALVPGGRLVVVDFERIEGQSRDWVLEHVRADRATFQSEIEAAGFELVDAPVIAGLEENYVLRFRRK
jgi:predicted methyltransferase